MDNTLVSTSIHARFAEQARRTPDAVAVSSGDVTLTYRQLDERANRFARGLLQAGVRPGDPVAILMERSPDVVVSMLAALKAGAFYLPLHDAYPLERMQQILDRAGSPLLLADPAMDQRGLPRTSAVRFPATGRGTAVASIADVDAGGTAGPDTTAYVMYTSGSTGEPKGVAVSHRGILGLADDSCWDGDAHSRVLALAPYAFGVSTYEVWVPLLRGGRIVLPPAGDLDVRTVRELIVREGITGLHVTAGLFRLFAEEAPDSFATVREVLTGGDVISPTAVRRVLDACPGLTVRAMYGATELSSFAAYATLTAPFEPAGAIPVGRPMDAVDARLLDEDLRPVPDGEVGELYIAGERLALGYHGRPDLTAERFVEEPGVPGSRMYRTGDLMRRGTGGLLEFAGRVGDQVKIRGYRVEPGEVEHVLARQPGVAHAAVVAREQEGGEKRLLAYIVPKTPAPDPAELRAAILAVLPDYMVPAAFVELSELPLTANGKLDRAALPDPAASGTGTGAPSRTERQDTLCALFARVLGVPGVGVDDSFFALGGQSLQAMRLASRIEAELGFDISVGDVLNHPTVAELDGRLQELAPTPEPAGAAR
ncbi:non-ribosomal peptide synthetase [Streptomyces sp. NPDC090298]|uniref:non-ribosomal peptide synthetase n=1 Tax=Streptomyces sp. NPDC090298 TaxID=3365959 RepID=UPI00380EB033